MSWLKDQYQRFYNYFIGDVTPFVRGAVIVGLIVLSLICILSATKGKSEIIVKKWFPLFMAIVFIVLVILYVSWTK